MINQEDFSHTTESKPLMPGKMLKEAREAQEITLEAVSQHLHLTVPTILSIEEDNYDKMPAPVYVRGYLRRYASFVKISSDDVLDAYEKNVKVKSKILEEVPSYVKKKPITSNHFGIRLITYCIGVLLLILVALWWKEHINTPTQPIKNPPTESEINTTSKKPTQPEPVQSAPQVESAQPAPQSSPQEKTSEQPTTVSPNPQPSEQSTPIVKKPKVKTDEKRDSDLKNYEQLELY